MRAPLSSIVKTTRVMNAVAAGTSAQNSASVDMAGYDMVRFTALFGALTATQVTSLKLQHSDDNATWSDVTGGATAALADGDGNKMLVAEYLRPSKRYVRAVVVRGTANAVIDGMIAEQYEARSLPVAADASVSKSVVVGPAA